MAVAKTIEIVSTSSESFDAAIRDGIAKASETVKGIEGAWVQDTKVIVQRQQSRRMAGRAQDHIRRFLAIGSAFTSIGGHLAPR